MLSYSLFHEVVETKLQDTLGQPEEILYTVPFAILISPGGGFLFPGDLGEAADPSPSKIFKIGTSPIVPIPAGLVWGADPPREIECPRSQNKVFPLRKTGSRS